MKSPFASSPPTSPEGCPTCLREALGSPGEAIRSVHRLDQVVGGVMVYARTAQAASALSRQIREGSFQKELPGRHPLAAPRGRRERFLDLLGRNPKTRRTLRGPAAG